MSGLVPSGVQRKSMACSFQGREASRERVAAPEASHGNKCHFVAEGQALQGVHEKSSDKWGAQKYYGKVNVAGRLTCMGFPSMSQTVIYCQSYLEF